MIRSLTLISALALAATTGTLFAQQPPAGQQPPAPPARGVESALALEAVQAAVSALPTASSEARVSSIPPASCERWCRPTARRGVPRRTAPRRPSSPFK